MCRMVIGICTNFLMCRYILLIHDCPFFPGSSASET